MSLIETLVLGAYAWAWVLYRLAVREVRRLHGNHLTHLERRVRRVETELGLAAEQGDEGAADRANDQEAEGN